MKKYITNIFVILVAMFLVACGLGEPCNNCGDTPTKGYENTYTEEREYYCRDCSSDCEFCSDKAKEHYTSGLGIIVFVCDDCYEDILEFNR